MKTTYRGHGSPMDPVYQRHILTQDGRKLVFVRRPNGGKAIYQETIAQGVARLGMIRVWARRIA